MIKLALITRVDQKCLSYNSRKWETIQYIFIPTENCMKSL